MIPDSASLRIEWLDTESLRNADDQPLDYMQVAYYAALMRDGGHVAPVVVNDDYSIRDGRHRWAAHVVLGRDRIRCVVVA